jgi:hypothetical protein
VSVTLLSLIVTGTVWGQEPPEETEVLEQDVGAAGDIQIAAYPSPDMNYQGYLTDSSGTPLDGTYTMIFSLWNSQSAGAGDLKWGPVTKSVQVSEGLFNVTLEDIDPHDSLDDPAYLEIKVNGTTLPRQPLRAVPYAMGLIAGSRLRGNTASGLDFGFEVVHANGRGILVNAIGADPYGRLGEYGIHNQDITYSEDGYAGPDTTLWLPAASSVLQGTPTATVTVATNGETLVRTNTTEVVTLTIPIQIAQPYGRPYLISDTVVYYKVENTTSINNASIKGRKFSTNQALTIGTNSTPQSQTSYSSFLIKATQDYTVTNTTAPTNIQLQVSMVDGSVLHVYGAKMTLVSYY